MDSFESEETRAVVQAECLQVELKESEADLAAREKYINKLHDLMDQAESEQRRMETALKDAQGILERILDALPPAALSCEWGEGAGIVEKIRFAENVFAILEEKEIEE